MSDDGLYGGLEKTFNEIKGPLRLDEFALFEAALHLFSLDDRSGDPENGFLLFQNYHFIGARKSIGKFGHLLQSATETLWMFSGEGKWRSTLENYMDAAYDGIRLFRIFENVLQKVTPGLYSGELRLADWSKFIFKRMSEDIPVHLAGNGLFNFRRSISNPDSGNGTVDLNFIPARKIIDVAPRNKGVRSDIQIPMEELFLALEELDLRNRELSQLDGKKRRDNHARTLRACMLKTAGGEPIDHMDINRFRHLVGAVGSGKSTLLRAMVIWCVKNGLRVCVLVPGVPESMKLCAELVDFGIPATPLMGKSQKLKQADRLMGEEITCPDPFVSSHLTGFCVMHGLDRNNHDFARDFDPCFHLHAGAAGQELKKGGKGKKKDNRKFACPCLEECPRHRMYMDAVTSPVVVTNPYSFSQTKVGAGQRLFLRRVLDEFDLVIADEADRIQTIFDTEFVPLVKLHEDCITPASNQANEFTKKPLPHQSRFSDSEYQYHHCLIDIDKSFVSLHRTLKNSGWSIVNSGREIWVFGLLRMLAGDDVAEKDEWKTPHIPAPMVEDIETVIRNRNSDYKLPLYSIIRATDDSDKSLYNKMYRDWLSKYDLSGGPERSGLSKDEYQKRLYDCLNVIFTMILFDIRLYHLGSACLLNPGFKFDSELLNFLFGKFNEQMGFMPKALCGNIFGLRAIRNEKKEVIDYGIVKLFAYGRALLSDLPWLKTDENGLPAGPHAFAMSGTSWLEGSLQMDVQPRPDFLLEAPEQFTSYLGGIEIYPPKSQTRVSGASIVRHKGESPKERAIRQLLGEYVQLILKNCDEGRKCLILANSYEQEKLVRDCLPGKFGMAKNPGIVIVRDSDDDSMEDGVLSSGNIEAFALMEEKILVAPCTIVGRALNIVLPNGHAAISSTFYLIRPFESPGALDALCGKTNGLVRSMLPPADGPIWKRNKAIRDLGVDGWRWVNWMDNRCFTQRDALSRRDIIATTIGLVTQSSGRMARVGDLSAPVPRIYFMDAAFGTGQTNENGERDFIGQMWDWLEGHMTNPETHAICKSLFAWMHAGFAKALGEIHGEKEYHAPRMATEGDTAETVRLGFSREMENRDGTFGP